MFPRYSLHIPVRFRIADLSTDMAEHNCSAVNISRYGMLLTSRTPLRIGAALDMLVRVPVEISGMAVQESRCRGRVVHRREMEEGLFGYGVRIERITPPHQRSSADSFGRMVSAQAT
ncbi:MAG TPA: PilZ domain-containing protein [Methylomirabilota bacterium]|nr:PilZ domain-containing protein [Methylomirabilota bacterium]